MKKTVVAFVLGALLATAAFALADQPIKLIVNGREVAIDPAPIMHQDRVFVPIRFVSEALGADVVWVVDQRAVIVISKAQEEPVTPQEPESAGPQDSAKKPLKEGEDVSNIQTYERDGYTFIIEDGVEYWPTRWIAESIYEKSYSLRVTETKEIYMTHNPYGNNATTITVLKDIPFKVFNGRSYIQKDYYENTILPLVK